jgi:hypothetical protein
MAQQTQTEEMAGEQLSVEHSAGGLTVAHSTRHPARTKNDGLQVIIRPGMVYMVEADPPSASRVGRHRRPAPVKAPRARGLRHLVATLAGVTLIFAGIALIAWTMAHQ